MVLTYRNKFNIKYKFPKDTSHSLQDISRITGFKLSGLQTIFNKGIGAYKTSPSSIRPSVKSPDQWAYARVYSSVMGGKASKIDAKQLINIKK